MNEVIRRKVTQCARCKKSHEKLEFKPIDNPPVDDSGFLWTHFAICPTNGQPVMMRLVISEGNTHE